MRWLACRCAESPLRGVREAARRITMTESLTLGVIGAGNMGAALVRGMVAAGALAPKDVVVCDAQADRAAALAREMGVGAAATNVEAAAQSSYVLIAVKPGVVGEVIGERCGHFLRTL